jgi:predicted house-cleaning NTP pyrophosphatase (Maf/HAM1 superfamily)
VENVYGQSNTILLIFVVADSPVRVMNRCEKKQLQIIAASKEDTVLLQDKCTVIAWTIFSDPQESYAASQMLEIWNITEHPVLYYQR